ncbi:MAG: acyltransferase [Algoriphagus sp.]
MRRLFQSLTSSLIRKPASGKFIPFIDGLRFLAIVPVIVQHANERLFKYGTLPDLKPLEAQLSFLISRGTVGVFLFFAISGFVLSLPIAKVGNREEYGSYLKRRLYRIEPPFLFWMSCCALLLLVLGKYPPIELLRHFAATITYTHQLFYQDYSIINPVAWSLEVEIQFYLLAPFIGAAYFHCQKICMRRIGLMGFILGWMVFQHTMGWQAGPWKATLLGQLPHFLIGMLVADLYHYPIARLQNFRFWDLLLPVFALVMAYSWTAELWKSMVFEVALLGIFLSAFYGKLTHRMLSLSWVAIIGGMCYSIYLIHLPILEGFYSFIGRFGQWSGYLGQLSISLSIALPLLFLCSIIAYRWVEQPFMRKGKGAKKSSFLINLHTPNKAQTANS